MKIRKEFVSTVCKLASDTEADSRTVKFVLSTAKVDSMGDTIDPDGWDLKRYKKNPVVLWGHDRHTPPIGKCENVRVKDGALVGDVTFATAEEFPLADTIFRLVKGGYLNAGSVGFMPIEYDWNDKRGGFDYKKHELREFSIVTIPSNPDALVVARSAGIDLSPVAAHVERCDASEFEAIREQLLKSDTSAALPATVASGRFRLRAAVASAVSKL